MMKYFITIFFTISLLFANESKTVKTSELELFLFKIGFQSLLKDVELTKDKSTLNSTELKKLNKKVEFIMNEITKDKRIVKEDSSLVNTNNTVISNEEIKLLKQQVKNLQTQLNDLKKSQPNIKTKIKTYNRARVSADFANIKSKPFIKAKNLRKVEKSEILEIKSCDRFQWCKIKDNKGYIAKYLLKFL